jgi:hypothetical protein
MMDNELLLKHLEDAEWEKAKGALRATVSLHRAEGKTGWEKWEKMDREVEQFIKYIEDHYF